VVNLCHGRCSGLKKDYQPDIRFTFGVVVVTMLRRWRLHPDSARSVDALLAHSSSSSSCTTDLEVPPHAAPSVETQLRSRVQDSQGSKLLVSFESGRVPKTAVWAAGVPPSTAPVWFADPAPATFQQPAAAATAQFQFTGLAAAQQQVGSKRGRDDDDMGGPAGVQHPQQGKQQQQQQQQLHKKKKTDGGPPKQPKQQQKVPLTNKQMKSRKRWMKWCSRIKQRKQQQQQQH
jgi:hypothetical protein